MGKGCNKGFCPAHLPFKPTSKRFSSSSLKSRHILLASLTWHQFQFDKMAPEDSLTESDLNIPTTSKYEYLDHTADVQIHSWGEDLKEAFEHGAVAMYGYMTEIDTVEIKEKRYIEVNEDDMQNLLFHFLDECLFLFCDLPFFIGRKVVITEFDIENFKLKATVFGEEFDLDKHPQGTEVKAITYSNMQIYNEPEQHELFVIIDI